MRLGLMAVGRLKDGPEKELMCRFLERARASGRPLGFSVVETLEIAESKAGSAVLRKAAEGRELLARLAGSPFVALDEKAAARDSVGFAEKLAAGRDGGLARLTFVIGGPDGLDGEVLAASRWGLSFGAMTLPHQLARLILVEQLYRAMTILAGHPYHRF